MTAIANGIINSVLVLLIMCLIEQSCVLLTQTISLEGDLHNSAIHQLDQTHEDHTRKSTEIIIETEIIQVKELPLG